MLRGLSILLAALALAGCGGGDDSASGDTGATEAVAEGSTAEETTADDTGTATSGGDTGTFAWASADCQSLVLAYAGLSAAIGAASTGQDVSADIEEFGAFVDKVPDEIRADVEALAAAYGEFLGELEDIGLTAGQTPSTDQIQALQSASESLGTAELQAAAERLTAWTTANCGS